MRMRISISITILTVTVILGPSILGQEILRSSNGCAVKEGIKPSLFISYEAQTLPNADKSKILLRLHNNLNCNIVIETDNILPYSWESELFKKTTTTLPNGNIKTRFIPDPHSGALVPIYYDRQRTSREKPRPVNYREGRDLVFHYTIPGGRSVIFPVDAKLFRGRFLISVPFTYEWEHGDGLHAMVEHRVYYLNELPSGY